MKALLATTIGLSLAVAAIPVLLANGDAPVAPECGIEGRHLDVVLATIRTLESGGRYDAESPTSTASGAYQFIDGTWNVYGGYRHAADAPPSIQDARAVELVTQILDAHAGRIDAVPVVWYIGHLPDPTSAEWDTIPAAPGNHLTPRQYQQRWITTYDRLLGDVSPAERVALSPAACRSQGQLVVDGWALPGPRSLIDANPAALSQPHHTYPAWDWIIPTGTPIFAIRGGTVVRAYRWPHNWWQRGCGTNPTGCVPCGIGLTILDSEHTRWSYCHGNSITVELGDHVAAGQQIMTSGDTGRSGTPHLHLEIRTSDGLRRCPQSLLRELVVGSRPDHAGLLPTSGCSF